MNEEMRLEEEEGMKRGEETSREGERPGQD